MKKLEQMIDNLDIDRVDPDYQQEFRKICGELKELGAEAVILGCTELGFVADGQNCVLPLFDTAVIHAESAAQYALNGDKQ